MLQHNVGDNMATRDEPQQRYLVVNERIDTWELNVKVELSEEDKRAGKCRLPEWLIDLLDDYERNAMPLSSLFAMYGDTHQAVMKAALRTDQCGNTRLSLDPVIGDCHEDVRDWLPGQIALRMCTAGTRRHQRRWVHGQPPGQNRFPTMAHIVKRGYQ
jgi:hypothetical protein